MEPHEFLQTHLSVEPPEQPLTSDVKVDSLRPKLKWKVLSFSPLLSSPLPPLLLQRLEAPELEVSQHSLSLQQVASLPLPQGGDPSVPAREHGTHIYKLFTWFHFVRVPLKFSKPAR